MRRGYVSLFAESLVSPKQSSRERVDWYPYYAGFTEKFVEKILAGPLARSRFILDPWNGSGTTTATCAREGLNSVGIDVNPVLTVIAKARLTPIATRESLLPLANQIARTAQRLSKSSDEVDLLRTWMRKDGVQRVRAIQSAIHSILTSTQSPANPDALRAAADELPILACFFYTVLFAAVRDLLARFRPSNPTWLTRPDSPRHRVAPGWPALLDAFEMRTAYFADRLTVTREITDDRFKSILTGSAGAQPFESESFDGALTSPPYATRIDYVKGVLLELAVLGANETAIKDLRISTTGTPVVRGTGRHADVIVSNYGREVLETIYAHSSKGSRAYYWPWMANYLLGLQNGLLETSRSVKRRSPVCVVVQDSHYKEHHVDLQRVVTETLEYAGRERSARYDFPAKTLRSRMNPRARRHLQTRSNFESLLVFG